MTSGMSVNPNHATGMVPGCNMGGNLPTLAALPHMGGGTSTLPIDAKRKVEAVKIEEMYTAHMLEPGNEVAMAALVGALRASTDKLLRSSTDVTPGTVAQRIEAIKLQITNNNLVQFAVVELDTLLKTLTSEEYLKEGFDKAMMQLNNINIAEPITQGTLNSYTKSVNYVDGWIRLLDKHGFVGTTDEATRNTLRVHQDRCKSTTAELVYLTAAVALGNESVAIRQNADKFIKASNGLPDRYVPPETHQALLAKANKAMDDAKNDAKRRKLIDTYQAAAGALQNEMTLTPKTTVAFVNATDLLPDGYAPPETHQALLAKANKAMDDAKRRKLIDNYATAAGALQNNRTSLAKAEAFKAAREKLPPKYELPPDDKELDHTAEQIKLAAQARTEATEAARTTIYNDVLKMMYDDDTQQQLTARNVADYTKGINDAQLAPKKMEYYDQLQVDRMLMWLDLKSVQIQTATAARAAVALPVQYTSGGTDATRMPYDDPIGLFRGIFHSTGRLTNNGESGQSTSAPLARVDTGGGDKGGNGAAVLFPKMEDDAMYGAEINDEPMDDANNAVSHGEAPTPKVEDDAVSVDTVKLKTPRYTPINLYSVMVKLAGTYAKLGIDILNEDFEIVESLTVDMSVSTKWLDAGWFKFSTGGVLERVTLRAALIRWAKAYEAHVTSPPRKQSVFESYKLVQTKTEETLEKWTELDTFMSGGGWGSIKPPQKSLRAALRVVDAALALHPQPSGVEAINAEINLLLTSLTNKAQVSREQTNQKNAENLNRRMDIDNDIAKLIMQTLSENHQRLTPVHTEEVRSKAREAAYNLAASTIARSTPDRAANSIAVIEERRKLWDDNVGTLNTVYPNIELPQLLHIIVTSGESKSMYFRRDFQVRITELVDLFWRVVANRPPGYDRKVNYGRLCEFEGNFRAWRSWFDGSSDQEKKPSADDESESSDSDDLGEEESDSKKRQQRDVTESPVVKETVTKVFDMVLAAASALGIEDNRRKSWVHSLLFNQLDTLTRVQTTKVKDFQMERDKYKYEVYFREPSAVYAYFIPLNEDNHKLIRDATTDVVLSMRELDGEASPVPGQPTDTDGEVRSRLDRKISAMAEFLKKRLFWRDIRLKKHESSIEQLSLQDVWDVLSKEKQDLYHSRATIDALRALTSESSEMYMQADIDDMNVRKALAVKAAASAAKALTSSSKVRVREIGFSLFEKAYRMNGEEVPSHMAKVLNDYDYDYD